VNRFPIRWKRRSEYTGSEARGLWSPQRDSSRGFSLVFSIFVHVKSWLASCWIGENNRVLELPNIERKVGYISWVKTKRHMNEAGDALSRISLTDRTDFDRR
jgi:hypothetical protein